MGMSFNPMYQPITTSTIKADGDLNISPYDLIAYDGKFDTVEADEFVGGVGNFSSGVVSGGMDVSGILHAESNLQVDGGIALEGSINNVNITPDGSITTAGTISADGGIDGTVKGTVIGNVQGFLFLAASVSGASGDFVCATGEPVAGLHMNNAPPSGVNYVVTPLTYPDENQKVSNGIYRNPSLVNNKITTRTAQGYNSYSKENVIYYKHPDEEEYHSIAIPSNGTLNFQLEPGEYMIYGSRYLDISILADTIYATYDAPL